jgi:hypothetical protein
MNCAKSLLAMTLGARLGLALLLSGCGGGGHDVCGDSPTCGVDLRACSIVSDCHAEEVCELDTCLPAPAPTPTPP